MVAEGSREHRIKVGHTDKSIHGVSPVAQPVQPAREQDRESTIAVDVRGHTRGLCGNRENPIVKGRYQVPEHVSIDLPEVFISHINLHPFADGPQLSPNSEIIAGSGNVAIADHQVEVPVRCGQGPGWLLDGLRPVGTGPGRTGSGLDHALGRHGLRGWGRLKPDRKRPRRPGKCRNDHQRF